MVNAGAEFDTEIIARIQEAVRSVGDLTRGGLARMVCGWLDWMGADGRLKETSCRIALNKLERKGVIELPAARPVNFTPRRTGAEAPMEWPQIRTSLAQLGTVELVPVSGDTALSRQWWAMMREQHPLGETRLCGAQLRYVIRCERGVLGGLAFSAAAWRLAGRDQWIGWSEGQRAQRLNRVVGNSRFLLLKSVQVPHLASQVLGLATRRLANDWQAAYGYRPVLVETFVDTRAYRGTSYRAANWIDLGVSQGRGRQDRERTAEPVPKRLLVYPLRRNWKKILNAPLEVPRLVVRPRAPPADWAEEEFGRARFSPTLKQRLLTVVRDFGARPQAGISEACDGITARIKGAYRLLSHRDTTIDTLLQSHYAATEERLAQHRGEVILAVQDTTSLNYSNLAQTRGLGPIGTTVDGAQGLHLHSTLAVTTQGVPLGFLDAQCWARDPAEFGKKKLRRTLPIEEKESHRWIKSYQAVAAVQERLPEATLVSVADREGDLYELFAETLRNPQGPKLLIRAKTDRALVDQNTHLFKTVQDQPIAGDLEVQLPRQKGRAARVAKLAIRYATVTMAPPQTKARLPAITVQAVQALEVGAPKGVEPIDWWLLTTLPVDRLDSAVEKVKWYALRWNIEVFHRTLKSGCRIEDRQLRDAQSLEACLAIDMVVAWRICYLVKLGREVPHASAAIYFEEAQWQALMVYKTRNPFPPEQPPSLGEAIRRVAALGGYQGRKFDGQPGTDALWRGLQRLDDITDGWIEARDALRRQADEIQQLRSRNQELTEAFNSLRVAMARGP